MTKERIWQPIDTVPEGVHVLLWFPKGEHGIGGIESATVFRNDPHTPHGFSFWTHGGPNSGSDWDTDEAPTYWMPLPSPPDEPEKQP